MVSTPTIVQVNGDKWSRTKKIYTFVESTDSVFRYIPPCEQATLKVRGKSVFCPFKSKQPRIASPMDLQSLEFSRRKISQMVSFSNDSEVFCLCLARMKNLIVETLCGMAPSVWQRPILSWLFVCKIKHAYESKASATTKVYKCSPHCATDVVLVSTLPHGCSYLPPGHIVCSARLHLAEFLCRCVAKKRTVQSIYVLASRKKRSQKSRRRLLTIAPWSR